MLGKFLLARTLQKLINTIDARLRLYGTMRVIPRGFVVRIESTGQEYEITAPNGYINKLVRRDRAVKDNLQNQLDTLKNGLGLLSRFVKPKTIESDASFVVRGPENWQLNLKPYNSPYLEHLELEAEVALFNSITADNNANPTERVGTFEWFYFDPTQFPEEALRNRGKMTLDYITYTAVDRIFITAIELICVGMIGGFGYLAFLWLANPIWHAGLYKVPHGEWLLVLAFLLPMLWVSWRATELLEHMLLRRKRMRK